MNILKFFLLGFSFIAVNFAFSQENEEIPCNILENQQKLHKKHFLSGSPLLLMVDNAENLYVKVQIGKRTDKIFLYLNVLAPNVCIEKERNVDVYFHSGEILRLKNDFRLNCEGIWVKQLSQKELQKFTEYPIQHIKIFSYHKDYELNISEEQDQNIKSQIECLKQLKVRK